MAYNNTVKLIGNMGSEARLIENEGKLFAAFSLATTDSYKDDKEQWHDQETIWHDILVFNPRVVEQVKALKKGTRLEVAGSLSYRPFETASEDGKPIKKKEASIIGHKLELRPLVKKVG